MKFRGSGGRGRCRQRSRGVVGWLGTVDRTLVYGVHDVVVEHVAVGYLVELGGGRLDIGVPVVYVVLAVRILEEVDDFFTLWLVPVVE